MESRSTGLANLAAAILTAIFAVQLYQAASEPITSHEAYTYDRFVRPTLRQQFEQELPNREFLYTLLEKRSVGLFHVSPWSVRLPGLLFGVLYLWTVWRFACLLFGRGRLAVIMATVVALIPAQFNCFIRADGTGAGIALLCLAVEIASEHLLPRQTIRPLPLNLGGVCLGLAAAVHWDFWMLSIGLASLLLGIFGLRSGWNDWRDRILIPASVAALCLMVLPVSHAQAAPELIPPIGVESAAQLQSALQVLRASAGRTAITIAASAAAEPVANFYRAQHRATNWGRADRNVAGNHDYYLLSREDAEVLDQSQRIVLFQDTDFILTRRATD